MANEFVTRRGIISLGGVTFPYVAVTGTYTVSADDYAVDCTSGTFTVTLPSAVGITGKIYVIKNSGAGVISVAATGGQLIDGSSPKTLNQYDSLYIQSTGAGWVIDGPDRKSVV